MSERIKFAPKPKETKSYPITGITLHRVHHVICDKDGKVIDEYYEDWGNYPYKIIDGIKVFDTYE